MEGLHLSSFYIKKKACKTALLKLGLAFLFDETILFST